MTAVDASSAALAVARRNAAKYGLAVRWLESDLLSAVTGRFDVIAANLPYVTEAEYAELEPELYHEPKSALTAPDEGLALIFRLIKEAPARLVPGGRLLLEVGERQALAAARAMTSAGYAGVAIFRDYCGVQRFVAGGISHE